MSAPAATIDRLIADLDGQVITPDHPEYDEARTVFPGDIDRLPAVIVRPTDASQVAQIVTVTRDSGLDLAVRSGGHSGAGHGVIDDGVVLDLSEMSRLEIDSEARTAWAETGLTAGEYTKAVGAQGLATGFGDTGSVGIGGITLGGGVGFLSRLHGLTIDDLLAAEIVTADGSVLEIDAERHPDLFWAIRGGGGNFGVATRFKLRLHEVPTVVGGMLILPAVPEVVAGLGGAAADAPQELSATVHVMPAPPMPFIPAEHQGRLVVMVLPCYAGPAEEGERALAPFRSVAEPIADLLRPMPYAEIYGPEPEGFHPTAIVRTGFSEGIEIDDAETIIERLTASDAPMRVVQIRALGGAIARVPADATAYAHRAARLMVNVASFYTGPDDRPRREEWVRELAARLHRPDAGAYVNFLSDEGPERVRAAYPGATWERLAEVKRRYDPDNLFRHNENVPPA
jgi:FAD/FMN-containing dehydrogenase